MKLNIQYFAEGKVVIETDLDTKQFDLKMEKLQTKYKNQQIDLEIKETNYEDARFELEEINNEFAIAKGNLDEINQKLEKAKKEYAEINEQINRGQAITPAQYIAQDRLSSEISDLLEKQKPLQEEYDKQNSKLNKAYDILVKTETAYTKQLEKVQLTEKEIGVMNSKIEEAKNKANKLELSNIKKSIDDIGKGTEKTIKKVGRWALAIFGIRSAYMFIRQEMSVLSEYNKSIGADLEYMRWAIANALKPIIEKIIQLAYKLLVYVGYIIKELFGINIFANASAKAFEKQKKALSGSNKEAKQLQKTLAGFDEMNIIQESGDTTRGGGGGGTPTQDLSKMLDKIEIPEWLVKLTKKLKELKDWIVDNWKWLGKLGTLLGIVFGASKVAGWLNNIGKVTGALGEGKGGLLGILKALTIIAATAIVIDIVYKIKSEGDELDTFAEKTNKTGIENWEKNIKNIINEEKGLGKVISENNRRRNIGYEALKGTQNILHKITGVTDTELKNAQAIAEYGQISVKEEFELYKNKKLSKAEQQQVVEDLKSQRQYLMDLLPILIKEGKDISLVEYYLEEINHDLNYASPKWGGITRLIDQAQGETMALCDKTGKTVVAWDMTGKSIDNAKKKTQEYNKVPLYDKISKIIFEANTSKAETSFSKFTSSITSKLQKSLNEVNFNKLTEKLVNLFAKMPGVSVSSVKKAFGLAKGGIVNLPGRGVPLASAIGGESGAEGVIPLTDSQQMALLGEAIGRYVRIDNVIDVNMDSRKIKRIMATSDSRDRMVGNG